MSEKGKILRIEDYMRGENVELRKDEFCGIILDFREFKVRKEVKNLNKLYYEGNYIVDSGQDF